MVLLRFFFLLALFLLASDAQTERPSPLGTGDSGLSYVAAQLGMLEGKKLGQKGKISGIFAL